MAGTDSTQAARLGGPAVILVAPQLAENIGTAARAMLNCGLTDLRLVRPRDGWPQRKAWFAASGADRVLDEAKLFPTPEAACADLQHVYATTARNRELVKPLMTPRAAAAAMRASHAAGETVGILFGPERTGLVTDDAARADVLVTVPLNPAYSSLNLAQAVLVMGYEWFTAADATPPVEVPIAASTRRANHAELEGFFGQLEAALAKGSFFRTEEMRPTMWRNVRNVFLRAGMTEQEVRTFRGAIKSLVGER